VDIKSSFAFVTGPYAIMFIPQACACYHLSVVACLNVCVYVCGVLPDKWQLIKNLIVQLYFCFRLDISSD
jgi:hypothetical protein